MALVLSAVRQISVQEELLFPVAVTKMCHLRSKTGRLLLRNPSLLLPLVCLHDHLLLRLAMGVRRASCLQVSAMPVSSLPSHPKELRRRDLVLLASGLLEGHPLPLHHCHQASNNQDTAEVAEDVNFQRRCTWISLMRTRGL